MTDELTPGKIAIGILLILTCLWPIALFIYGWHSAKDVPIRPKGRHRTVIVL